MRTRDRTALAALDVRLWCDGPSGANGGFRYTVVVDGNTVLTGSRDPEHDLARLLLARGVAGRVPVCDGQTGAHRMTVDIERAAQWMAYETDAEGFKRRRVACRWPRETDTAADLTASRQVAGTSLPAEENGAAAAAISDIRPAA